MARNQIIIRRPASPDESDNDQNPIDDRYNNEFNDAIDHNGPSSLNDAENEQNNNDNQDSNDTANDLNDQENNNNQNNNTKNDKRSVADRERTPSERWKNNTSPASKDKDGKSHRARIRSTGIFIKKKNRVRVRSASTFIKKRSAAMLVVALLGLGGAVPFIGMSSLPMAILGNLDAKSLLQPLSAYLQDYYGFKFFGVDLSKKGSVASDGDTFAGLRDTEIEELKKNGVEFPEEGKKLKSGKIVYDKIVIDGKEITPSSFKQELRQNPGLRRKVIFQKGSYFKSAKSAATKKLKSCSNIQLIQIP